MTNEIISQSVELSNQWKQIFESAVGELDGNHGSAQPDKNVPIARRRIATPPVDPVTAEKRAITDAAKALAALWKRPEKPRRPMNLRQRPA